MNEFERRKVIEAHWKSGKKASDIVKLTESIPISRKTVYNVVKTLRNGQSSERKKGSGRKILSKTKQAQVKIRKRLRRKSDQSVRKIAKEVGIPKSTAAFIVKKKLKLHAYKKTYVK